MTITSIPSCVQKLERQSVTSMTLLVSLSVPRVIAPSPTGRSTACSAEPLRAKKEQKKRYATNVGKSIDFLVILKRIELSM